MKNQFFIFLLSFSIIQCKIERRAYDVSVPKSGTHMVFSLFKLMAEESNYSIKMMSKWPHLKYIPQHKEQLRKINAAKFLIVRDLRDQLISFIFWGKRELQERRGKFEEVHRDPLAFKESWPDYIAYEHLSMNDLITELIKGGSAYYDGQGPYLGKYHVTHGIKEFYNSYLPWMNEPGFYTIKFENLIGPQGGGSYAKQIKEISNIAKHLSIKLTLKQIQNIAKKLFGKKNLTFRKGQIGTWKDYFTPEHKKLFKEVAGDLLIKLGYEKNHNW